MELNIANSTKSRVKEHPTDDLNPCVRIVLITLIRISIQDNKDEAGDIEQNEYNYYTNGLCISYLQVSKPPEQKQILLALNIAREQGFTVVERYIDIGISGSGMKN
ncbi:hypothetical protein [Paenibacillus antarcticus]|uniref:Uncharacterized protein n=1 Tax=Paenibacillus antarcticus TaxID=253703 RepID=A0A162MH80_9BACL|nr:hypothetical protein [Paenibacillus antarcticus]OAB44673.1 hypothetical protein PBAT_15540 [Paenibacillus antarcticus]